MSINHIKGAEIKKAKLDNGLVVVEFFGDFCTSCKVVEKSLVSLAEKYDQVRFFKISAISDLKFAQSNDVASLPTVIYFKDGKKLLSFSGFRPIQHLEKALLVLLNS